MPRLRPRDGLHCGEENSELIQQGPMLKGLHLNELFSNYVLTTKWGFFLVTLNYGGELYFSKDKLHF